MTSTTLHPEQVPAGRRAVGYRWEDERWKEEPPLPHGSFGAMGGMLTSIRDLGRYVGVFLDAWPPRDGARGGPDAARVAARDAAAVAPVGAARHARRGEQRSAPDAASYGYGLSVTQTCVPRRWSRTAAACRATDR